jgi:1-acyl-sn-glycerol-3-phosphate acyltransferase
MKKELLWDPCLDIGGNRLPNVFVDRKSKNREAELMQIRGLAEGMGRHDGILIYPEGTRFSRKKLAASLERLKASGRKELYELALKMKNVLPPRPAGVQEIFDAAPEADVVFCAHAGFEGAVNMYQLLHGALVGALIKMKYWRVPASLIPKGHEERMVWLYERWLEVDRWISEHLDARSSPQPAAATAE